MNWHSVLLRKECAHAAGGVGPLQGILKPQPGGQGGGEGANEGVGLLKVERDWQSGDQVELQPHPPRALLPGGTKGRSASPPSWQRRPRFGRGRRLPEWELREHSADTPPRSPALAETPLEEVTLVPYGAVRLRVTEFPWLSR